MNQISLKKQFSEFESLTDEGENLLWVGKPYFKSFVSYVILQMTTRLLFAGAIIGYIYYPWNDGEEKSISAALYILGFFFLPSFFSLLGRILSYKKILYAFSDKRVMIQSGFFETSIKVIDYDKIIDLSVKRNLIDQMFETGTIKFATGQNNDDDESPSKFRDSWLFIEKPHEVFKKVKKVMVDIKTDHNYPNANRPSTNPGYQTKYKPN